MGLRNIFGQRAARWGLLLGMWVLATSAHSAPFEDSMAQRTLACSGCHGPQGRSGPDGYYPRLAGKPAGYLYNQLINIQQGRRNYALMQNLLAPLDARYLREIAQYFSDLDIPYPPPVAQSRDPALLARGAQLARQGDAALNIPPCMQCHGQALTGVAPSVPGLLGLPRDYLNAQLGSWQTGLRQAQAPDCMASIAKRLNESDVHALSNWLASQPLPAQPRAATQRAPLPLGAKDIRCGSAPW